MHEPNIIPIYEPCLVLSLFQWYMYMYFFRSNNYFFTNIINYTKEFGGCINVVTSNIIVKLNSLHVYVIVTLTHCRYGACDTW